MRSEPTYQYSRAPIGFRLAHELEGLLRGIQADGVITEEEQNRLRRWLIANEPYADVRPFSELAKHVERALADGRLTTEECADLVFVTGKYTTVNPHFDAFRGGLQVLMGVLAAISADGALSEKEARGLSDWLDDWTHLNGLWPYEECKAIVSSMLARQRVAEEAKYLLSLAQEIPIAGHVDGEPDAPPLITGVCAVDPDLRFHGRCYVFTGESYRAGRAEMTAYVEQLGGRADDGVTKRTDYLIVCDEGCPHWAFACYGRKVEKAYQMRREGHRILLVHEVDFWDALTGHSAAL